MTSPVCIRPHVINTRYPDAYSCLHPNALLPRPRPSTLWDYLKCPTATIHSSLTHLISHLSLELSFTIHTHTHVVCVCFRVCCLPTPLHCVNKLRILYSQMTHQMNWAGVIYAHTHMYTKTSKIDEQKPRPVLHRMGEYECTVYFVGINCILLLGSSERHTVVSQLSYILFSILCPLPSHFQPFVLLPSFLPFPLGILVVLCV